MRRFLIFTLTLALLFPFPTPAPADEAGKAACFAAPMPTCLLLVARDMAGRVGDHAARAKMLARIGMAQAQQGEAAAARVTVARADEAVSRIGDSTLWWTYIGARIPVAAAWALLGDTERAAELLNAAPETTLIGFSMGSDIAAALIAAGKPDVALEVAQATDHALARFTALKSIARAYLAAGDMAAMNRVLSLAEETVNRTGNPQWKRFNLISLGHLQLGAGHLDAAVRTASRIAGTREYHWLALQIAAVQTRNGEYDAAKGTVDSMRDTDMVVTALTTIAALAAKTEHRDRAKTLLEEAVALTLAMPNGKKHDEALGAIAWYHAATGDYGKALQTVGEIDGNNGRDRILPTILSQMVKTDDVTAAAAIPSLIHAPRKRADAYADLGAARAKHGNPSAARRAFAKAMEATRGIDDEQDRADALSAVMKEQAQSGDIDGALETATAMQTGLARRKALGNIAVAMARAGKMREAVELARDMGTSVSAVYALVDIAAAWKKPR